MIERLNRKGVSTLSKRVASNKVIQYVHMEKILAHFDRSFVWYEGLKAGPCWVCSGACGKKNCCDRMYDLPEQQAKVY